PESPVMGAEARARAGACSYTSGMKGTSLVAAAVRSAILVTCAIAAAGCQRTTERAAEPTDVATSTTSTPPTGTAQPRPRAPGSDRPLPPLPDPLPGARTDLTTAVGAASRGA